MGRSQRTSRAAWLALVVTASPALAGEGHPSLPDSVGALGDSITAGAFANFRRTDGIHPWKAALFFQELVDYVLLGGNASIIERKDLSWSTGYDQRHRVKSHADYLYQLRNAEDLPKFTIRRKNVAVTGALMREVTEEQLPKLLKWSRQNLHKGAPDYVTLLAGANDICGTSEGGMTSTGDYIANLEDTLRTLLEASGDTRVLVSSLPRMNELSVKLANETLTGGDFAGTCSDFWKFSKVCSRVTMPDSPEELAQVELRLQEYFEATQSLVADLQAQFGDRVRFSTVVAQTSPEPHLVSMDCFHPSHVGQNELALKTWKESWWGAFNPVPSSL